MFRRIKFYIKKLLAPRDHRKREKNKRLRTKRIRKQRASDMERWSKKTVLHENWNERTLKLFSFIKECKSLIEFGAGNGILGNYLSDHDIKYQPVDVIKRSPEFLVCDLNVNPIQISIEGYDVALFSGVLEYVYDIDLLMKQLSTSINQVVLSYACRDTSNQDRFINGWLSDFSSQELEKIFSHYNYKIVNKEYWKDQMLYNLIKEND